jgi:transposase
MHGAEQLAAWTLALNLPGYEVTHVAEDGIDDVLRLNVVRKDNIGLCPTCGRPSNTIHEKRWIEDILDLPLGGRPVRLKVRVDRFECEVCDRTWTPPSPILAPGTWATNRLVERAAELVRRSDVVNAATFFGIPEKTLERWYYEYVERQQAASADAAEPIRALGIDELSLKKSSASSSR